MIDTIYWTAASLAVAGAIAGNRTAWLLLASALLVWGLDRVGAPFDLTFWALIDLLVVLAIVRPSMSRADVAVAVLFIPAWCFYLVPDPTRHVGSTLTVALQFALTFPFAEALRRGRFWMYRVKASAAEWVDEFVTALGVRLARA